MKGYANHMVCLATAAGAGVRMSAFKEVMNANRSGAGSLTSAALRVQQALEYRQARSSGGATTGSLAAAAPSPRDLVHSLNGAAAEPLQAEAHAAAAEEPDLAAKLPLNAPSRVRSAVAAAMQYRQAKAAKTAAAASAAAAAAALAPKQAAAAATRQDGPAGTAAQDDGCLPSLEAAAGTA